LTESLAELADRLRPRLRQPAPTLGVELDTWSPAGWKELAAKGSVLVDNRELGRVRAAAPWKPDSVDADGHYLHLSGPYVEANRPNGNGAMWTTEDLRFGLPTVTGGPVNWQHDDRQVFGAIVGSDLREKAADDHITVKMTLWRWLRPDLVDVVSDAVERGQLWQSMECVYRKVRCVDDTDRPGCGQTFTYGEHACEHIIERVGVRHLMEPVFLGSAVLVAPNSAAWEGAILTK
jgi:hypothetical protein